MKSDIIKIVATIIALILGLIVFAILPALAALLTIATIVGIFVWIMMGKVYSSTSVVRFVLWLRGRTVAGLSGDVNLKDISNLEKGYFILDEEEEEIEETSTRTARFWSHVRECFVKPWIPILFLISLAINLLKFAEFIPSIAAGITQEEAIQLLININIIIYFVSPVILGLIMPGLFILHDYSLYYFQRIKGNLEIEKSSGFGQKLLEGFVGGSALLGFIKFFIELATSPSEQAGLIALIFLIAIGTAAHSVVVTLFFYLRFHRRYVRQLNKKLARMGLPRAIVEIQPIKRA
ncbi:MAG: hypothetical protein ACFFCD_09905 [Promethearchaeota archaeon]